MRHTLWKVAHGPVATAETRRMADRLRHVALGQRYRLAKRDAKRQLRGDGGGKGATRTVRVAALHPFVAKLDEFMPVEQQVADVRRREMPSLDEHGGCTAPGD